MNNCSLRLQIEFEIGKYEFTKLQTDKSQVLYTRTLLQIPLKVTYSSEDFGRRSFSV